MYVDLASNGLTWLQHTLQEQKATHQKPCKKYRESETVCRARTLPCCTLYDFEVTIFIFIEHVYPWLDATENATDDQIKPSPTLKIIFQTTFLCSCNGKAKDKDEGKVENSVANPKVGCQTVGQWPREKKSNFWKYAILLNLIKTSGIRSQSAGTNPSLIFPPSHHWTATTNSWGFAACLPKKWRPWRYFPRVDVGRVQQVVEEVVVAWAGCHRVKTRANTWMRLREALIGPTFCLKEFCSQPENKGKGREETIPDWLPVGRYNAS